MVAKATPSLSPKRIAERTQLHRQAVMVLARLAAKRAVQDQLRAQGVRVSLVPHAEIMRQAREYLDAHPELYREALERAKRMGYIDPLGANLRVSLNQSLLLFIYRVRNNDRSRSGNSMAACAAISRAGKAISDKERR